MSHARPRGRAALDFLGRLGARLEPCLSSGSGCDRVHAAAGGDRGAAVDGSSRRGRCRRRRSPLFTTRLPVTVELAARLALLPPPAVTFALACSRSWTLWRVMASLPAPVEMTRSSRSSVDVDGHVVRAGAERGTHAGGRVHGDHVEVGHRRPSHGRLALPRKSDVSKTEGSCRRRRAMSSACRRRATRRWSPPSAPSPPPTFTVPVTATFARLQTVLDPPALVIFRSPVTARSSSSTWSSLISTVDDVSTARHRDAQSPDRHEVRSFAAELRGHVAIDA